MTEVTFTTVEQKITLSGAENTITVLPYTVQGDRLSIAARATFVTAVAAGSYTDMSDGIVVTAAGLEYVKSASATAIGDLLGFLPNGDTTVMHFGATGTGLPVALSTKFASLAAAQAVYPFATALTQTLDWAGAQAAHNHEKSKRFTVSPLTNVSYERAYNYKMVWNPGRSFWLNESLDMTGVRTAYTKTFVEADGATIVGEAIAGGYPIIDMLGSRKMAWHGGTCIGLMASPPRAFLQWGRTTSSAASDSNFISHAVIAGSFTLGAIYNYASEESHAHHVTIRNYGPSAGGEHTDGRSFCLVQDGDHYFGAKSKYQTVAALNTPASFLQNVFSHCDFRQTNKGSSIFLNQTSQHTFSNCYFVSEQFAGFEIYSNTSIASAERLDLTNTHFETDFVDSDPATGMKYGLYFDAVGAGSTAWCNGMKFEDSGGHPQLAFFAASANVTTVLLRDSRVNIGQFARDVGQLLFDTPSKYQVRGDWALDVEDTTAIRLAGVSSFSGSVSVPSAQNAVAQGATGTYTIQEGSIVAAQNNTYRETPSSGLFIDYFIDAAQTIIGRLDYNSINQTYSVKPSASDGFVFSDTAFYPSVDGTKNLGLPNRYWDTGYIASAIIKALSYPAALGVGGSVTQATSKVTGVTLDKICGRITTAADALGAGESADFVLTNSLIGTTSVVTIVPVDTANYSVQVLRVAADGATIRLTNITAGSLSAAVLLNFEVRTISIT
jgi:hypothetical protein